MNAKRKISLTLLLVLLLPSLAACRRATLKGPSFGKKETLWQDSYQEQDTPIARPAEVLSILDPKDERLVEEYFGPLPTVGQIKTVYHKPVKALYIASGQNVEENIKLIKETEVNAVVLDFKETWGYTYPSHTQYAKDLDLNQGPLDMKELVTQLKDAGAYVIARITCFKDSELVRKKPEWAIHDREGNVLHWSLESGEAFLSPYNTEVWDFLVSSGLEAIELGADEVQFDYVRFPSGQSIEGTKPYYGPSGQVPNKVLAINRFLEYARTKISDTLGVPISADVFPSMILNEIDAEILGQEWATMGLTGITSLCPMIYPSHYASVGANGEGSYIHGELFEIPDLEPYGVVKQTLLAAEARVDERLSIQQQEAFAYVRPYLQAFDATWLGWGYYQEYDAETIREQMQSCYDLGYNEWILWNVYGEYDPAIFEPAKD